MIKKISHSYRITLIGIMCLLAISACWKAFADTRGGVYECFFDVAGPDILWHAEAQGKDDAYVEATDTVQLPAPLSHNKSTILSSFSFVSDRYSAHLLPNSFVTIDLYQYHPSNPSNLELLAQGINAMVSEDRWLINDLNGQLIMAFFTMPGNEDFTQTQRTIKPGYIMVAKFSSLPTFYCLGSKTHGPICLIRGTQY